jgi:alcohol dehydrogenase
VKAAVYEKFDGPITVQNVPDQWPPADGVLVRVRANGICRSDCHRWKGHIPFVKLPQVPGHEFAGVILHAEVVTTSRQIDWNE